MSYKIRDNFLPEIYLKSLKELVFNEDGIFPWFWALTLNPRQIDKSYDTYFYHTLYDNTINSPHYEVFEPILKLLEVKSLIRLKVNCYPWQENLVEHTKHIDYDFDHKGAILSLNTCNGYTILNDGKRIDSIENRLLEFNPREMHASTNTSNAKARINININYF